MASDVRLEVLKALIAKLPMFELMWPDTLKDRWFAAFHRLLAEASKVGWHEQDPIASAVRAELQPLEDALIDAGHKLAKDGER
jgi:hypothetical protein